MFQMSSPLSRINGLVPVSPDWLARWEQIWKQRVLPELQRKLREDAKRAQEMRQVSLF